MCAIVDMEGCGEVLHVLMYLVARTVRGERMKTVDYSHLHLVGGLVGECHGQNMAEGVVKFTIGAQTALLPLRPDGDEKPDELFGEGERLARACRCALKSQHDSL